MGAGGGSIAWFDRDGLLKVGPASAGADPGPACYGRGGDRPTVTDANLVLGRLSSRGLLAGEMRLDESLSRAAFAPVAARLGFDVERTAHGVLGIVVANMVRAIRTISVERGYDPREFTLMAFGGAGPLHARDVALALGMREILVPAAPGILCAQGLIVSDLKEDFVAGERVSGDAAGLRRLASLVDGLTARARAWFDAEGVPSPSRRLELAVDARYVGQNFELAVPVATRGGDGRAGRGGLAEQAGLEGAAAGLGSDGDPMPVPTPDALRERFLEVHEAAYGYANPHDPIEIVNVRLTARGRLFEEPTACEPGDPGPPPEPVRAQAGAVRFRRRVADCPVYDRESLRAGHTLNGPAIVEQLDSTTPIFPQDTAVVDPAGNLVIRIAETEPG